MLPHVHHHEAIPWHLHDIKRPCRSIRGIFFGGQCWRQSPLSFDGCMHTSTLREPPDNTLVGNCASNSPAADEGQVIGGQKGLNTAPQNPHSNCCICSPCVSDLFCSTLMIYQRGGLQRRVAVDACRDSLRGAVGADDLKAVLGKDAEGGPNSMVQPPAVQPAPLLPVAEHCTPSAVAGSVRQCLLSYLIMLPSSLHGTPSQWETGQQRLLLSKAAVPA